MGKRKISGRVPMLIVLKTVLIVLAVLLGVAGLVVAGAVGIAYLMGWTMIK